MPAPSIPETELEERFIRASGPGGQNVNKVATAVELRFDVAHSPSLPEAVRARLLARRDRRLTGDGVLVITAQRFRTQERNRQDARERLAAFIESGLHAPKARVATRVDMGRVRTQGLSGGVARRADWPSGQAARRAPPSRGQALATPACEPGRPGPRARMAASSLGRGLRHCSSLFFLAMRARRPGAAHVHGINRH
jgi:ribosome-associated protein